MSSFKRRVCFLLAVLLCPYLAAGEDGGTAEGKPEPPQSLTTTPQGPNIMLVTWKKSPSIGVNEYFTYVEGTALEDTILYTFKAWDGLVACTTYTFGVQAVSSSGVKSDPAVIDGKTEDDMPPEPQGLRVESSTYNAVTLAWEKPDTLCDIQQYRVTYEENGPLVEQIFVTETTAEVSQLKPETLYTFRVTAFTSVGEGAAASITQTTAEAPIGPPQNLTAEGISSSAINVSWSEPDKPPPYYLLTAFDTGIVENRVFVPQYLLDTGLEACKTYVITVASYYEDDGTRFEATTRGTTKADIPAAPKDCSVEAYETYITVQWDKPTTYCTLGPYSVHWTVKKLWGNFEEESFSTNTLGTSIMISGQPLPYHSYTFEIAASVDGIFGDSTSCSAISLETSAGPPELVSVVSEEQGEVQVTWEPPADENGQIIQYGILVNNESVKEVSGEVRTTTITLQPCVSVDISVAARNHAGNNDGWGQRSEAKSVTPAGDCDSLQDMSGAGRGE